MISRITSHILAPLVIATLTLFYLYSPKWETVAAIALVLGADVYRYSRDRLFSLDEFENRAKKYDDAITELKKEVATLKQSMNEVSKTIIGNTFRPR